MFKIRQQVSFLYPINKNLIKDLISIVVVFSMLFSNTLCLAGNANDVANANEVFTAMPICPGVGLIQDLSLSDQNESVVVKRVGVLRLEDPDSLEDFNIGFKVSYALSGGTQIVQDVTIYVPLQHDNNGEINIVNFYIETPEISGAGLRGESWNINPGDDGIGHYLEILIVNNSITLITEHGLRTDTVMGSEFTFTGPIRVVGLNNPAVMSAIVAYTADIMGALMDSLNLEDSDNNNVNPDVENVPVGNVDTAMVRIIKVTASVFPALALGAAILHDLCIQRLNWWRWQNEENE